MTLFGYKIINENYYNAEIAKWRARLDAAIGISVGELSMYRLYGISRVHIPEGEYTEKQLMVILDNLQRREELKTREEAICKMKAQW